MTLFILVTTFQLDFELLRIIRDIDFPILPGVSGMTIYTRIYTFEFATVRLQHRATITWRYFPFYTECCTMYLRIMMIRSMHTHKQACNMIDSTEL